MKSANHVACAAALGWLLPPAVVSQRFRAMEALPTLAPRYYQPASPMLWPENLDKRQSSGQCEAGFHPCLDIGPLGSNSCCADDT
ncbi:hypothetical protein VTK73DRAFT_5660 [Phialemonium thermophilum]|uniref:Secreted protein n=1 Tax=Phialemonium thermophilum TaxID=223376 RepID=A0ABR3WMA0_9PEZI